MGHLKLSIKFDIKSVNCFKLTKLGPLVDSDVLITVIKFLFGKFEGKGSQPMVHHHPAWHTKPIKCQNCDPFSGK